MVQGDRDAAGLEDAARKLGTFCKEHGIELNLGSQGALVRILTESGARCYVHRNQDAEPNVSDKFDGAVIDFRDPTVVAVRELLPAYTGRKPPIDIPRMAWGLRLAALDLTSDAFLFFPGRQGTMAHLVPILASIIKGEAEEGKTPRKVALVGWDRMDEMSIYHLLQLPDYRPTWLFDCPLSQIEKAVDFLTAEPPTARLQ